MNTAEKLADNFYDFEFDETKSLPNFYLNDKSNPYYDVEGIPVKWVACRSIGGIGRTIAYDPIPRPFPYQAVMRNGTPITFEDFVSLCEKYRAKEAKPNGIIAKLLKLRTRLALIHLRGHKYSINGECLTRVIPMRLFSDSYNYVFSSYDVEYDRLRVYSVRNGKQDLTAVIWDFSTNPLEEHHQELVNLGLVL